MAPDNARLERLIETAFDRLPEPAPARLRAIEQRLAGTAEGIDGRRSSWIYWWLLVGLTATGAAAWWAGEYLYPESRAPHVAPQVPAGTTPSERLEPRRETPPERPGAASEAPMDAPSQIYRRERY